MLKALPKMLKQVSDEKMKTVLSEYLEQTKEQVVRLKQIFEHLDEKPTGKHCSGMKGCSKEITEALEEDEEGALKDAGIIGASLRPEHYEITGYSAAIVMAKTLTETLREEQAAAKNTLAGSTSILKEAASQKDEKDYEDEEEEEKDHEEQESEQKTEQDEKDAEPVLTDKKQGSAKKKARSR